jgi:hypothetical protein
MRQNAAPWEGALAAAFRGEDEGITRMNRRHYTLIGSAIGIAGFLAVGLTASIAWGGYAGRLLAEGIFGHGGESLLASALVVFGSIKAVIGIGGLFAVMGAAVGAAVAAIVRAAPEHEPHEP